MPSNKIWTQSLRKSEREEGSSRMTFSVACGKLPAGLWVCVGGVVGVYHHLGLPVARVGGVCALLFNWLRQMPAGQRETFS